jgi:hypothetical protein
MNTYLIGRSETSLKKAINTCSVTPRKSESINYTSAET